MKEYQERVVAEKNELDGKIQKLIKFMGSTQFEDIDIKERERLIRQGEVMQLYSNILNGRINSF